MVSHGQLLEAVRHQIDYYFSIDNLVKDLFLRRKMDDGGWIPTAVSPPVNALRVRRAVAAAHSRVTPHTTARVCRLGHSSRSCSTLLCSNHPWLMCAYTCLRSVSPAAQVPPARRGGGTGGRWVLQVIASFNRVRMLTPELGIIVEAVRGSTITELSRSGAALRCREGAQQWVLPPQERHAALQSPVAAAASAAMAAAGAVPSSGVTETFQPVAARTGAAVPEPAGPASAGVASQPVPKQAAPADSPKEVAADSGAVKAQEPATAEASASQQAAAPETLARPRIVPPPLSAAAMRKGEDEVAQDDMFQLDEVLPVPSVPDLLTFSRPLACKHRYGCV